MKDTKNILYIVLAVFVLTITAGAVNAIPSPSVVTGNITWANGTAISGADINVTCQHLGSNTTMSEVSLSDGTYFAVFNQTTCDFNDPVWVFASFDGMSGMNSGNMCDGESCFIPVAIVNVSIPEFGLLGAMLVLLAGIGIIAYRRDH